MNAISFNVTTLNDAVVDTLHDAILAELDYRLTHTQSIMVGFYLTMTEMLAVIGNCLVIYVILSDRKMRKKTHNILLLNIAIPDAGIAAFVYPFTTIACYMGRWPFKAGGCVYIGFMATFFCITSINMMAGLSIFRYIAVCKPKYHYLMDRPQTAAIFVLSAWGYSFLWAVAPLFGWSSYVLEAFGTSCSIHWAGRSVGDVSYTILMTVFCYVSHIIIMIFCYTKIKNKSTSVLKALRSKEAFSVDDAVQTNRFKGEQKVTYLSIVMVTVFTVVWSPYAWVAIWIIIDPPSVPGWLTTFPTVFAKSSCMLNPLIYFALNKKFRHDATRVLFAKRSAQVNDVTAAAIHARYRMPNFVERRAYVINTTKEGIYIGDRRVSLQVNDHVF